MKILIVEDDEKISSFLQKGLKEENFVVDYCYDGEEGLYLATTNIYSLIILDLMIPKLDGISLCKKLREKNNNTPIIMLTAKGNIEDKVLGLNEGANDYLAKPFAFEELLARIKVQLRTKDIGTNVLKLDTLELDTNLKLVKRAGQIIKLTSKEYTLLEFLFRNKNKIINEELINESLWDMEQDTASNVVNVYMYRLRNKIDKTHDVKLLHTIRGIGYKLGVQ